MFGTASFSSRQTKDFLVCFISFRLCLCFRISIPGTLVTAPGSWIERPIGCRAEIKVTCGDDEFAKHLPEAYLFVTFSRQATHKIALIWTCHQVYLKQGPHQCSAIVVISLDEHHACQGSTDFVHMYYG